MSATKSMDMQTYYPECLKVTQVEEGDESITITLKSAKHRHICPGCGEEMQAYHGTYRRTVQDLPILHKNVKLKIIAYEYNCGNPDCEVATFVEDYDGFVGRHGRMTRRCEDFVRALALETNCEGAAMICKLLGIKISGDTIIGLLRKLTDCTIRPMGDVIGVDDFAYRKGKRYCTAIYDGVTHATIDILEGRDGTALREWLKRNKQVKIVTRDRASAYAKAIADELPHAMQIADRFHLHQNLLTAIKEALKQEIPNQILMPNSCETPQEPTQTAPIQLKKTEFEKLSAAEKRRCEGIRTIQKLLAEGYAPVQIKEMLHTTYFTIRRYATGDPLKLCRFGGDKPSELDKYRDGIISLLQENTPQNRALEKIWELGYSGKRTAFRVYCRKLVDDLEIPYTPRKNAAGAPVTKHPKPKKRYVTKAELLKHLWAGKELERSDLDYILHKYPLVVQLNQCILDFRKIYTEKSLSALDEFITCYEKSASKPISSFANGLSDDLAAVKNSIIYNWNSGFAEGCNNKIKAIKRLMYGRAKVDLLRVKVLFAR